MMTALATHAGDQLGGGCVRVEDMLHKFGSERSLARNVKQILRSGMRIPGFNHPIYPDGDPRSPLLIDIAKELQRRGSRRNPAIDLASIVAGESGQLPNIEVALVAMTMAMQLPPYTACGIWALGRSAGWIAHVMEQRLTGVMLRPRARYGIASTATR
jgi:citrate synthase